MLVKLCGIRSDSDLDIAVAAGADWLGFLCGLAHASEDGLEPEEAARLISRVPARCEAVLVTHLTPPSEVVSLFQAVGASRLQLHGEMAVDQVAEVRRLLPTARLTGVVHVAADAGAHQAVAAAQVLAPHVDALLTDSRTQDRLGGTGKTHDWAISAAVAEATQLPLVLAGGLKPENLAAAIAVVKPAAVDVNSGVEDARGDKDSKRCAAFCGIAHSAERSALS